MTQKKLVRVARHGDGTIWTSVCGSQPRQTHDSVQDFIADEKLWRGGIVQLIGTQETVPLLVGFYDALAEGPATRRHETRLQVGTPLICPTRRSRKSAEEVLYYMRRANLPPSLGGFHDVQENELVPYRLNMLYTEEHPQDYVCEREQDLLFNWPMYRALSFVSTLQLRFICTLLSVLLDPRWYIDVTRPERTSKMESALGISHAAMSAVLFQNAHPKAVLCHASVIAWSGYMLPTLLGQVAELLSYEKRLPEPQLDDLRLGWRPGDFCWRILLTHLVREPDQQGMVRGAVRATQKFIRFLRHVWLNELYRGRGGPGGQGDLFVPSQFFTLYPVEAEAFQYHIYGTQPGNGN